MHLSTLSKPPDYLVKYKERAAIEGVSTVDYKLVSKQNEKEYAQKV